MNHTQNLKGNTITLIIDVVLFNDENRRYKDMF